MERISSSDRVVVCYATDNRYAQHTAASVASLITTFNPERSLSIYVLHNGELDDLHRFRLRKLQQLSPQLDVKIEIKPVGELQLLDLPLGNYPIEIYYRILLPRLFPRLPRVIYLDCDTIVVGDISPLFDLDMDGAPFAAVPDIEAQKNSDHLAISREGFKYCNSGVLLMDLDMLRHEQLDSQFIEIAMQNSDLIEELPDQHALNLLMANHYRGFKYLGYEWNYYCIAPRGDSAAYRAVPASRILHLIAAPKPWSFSEEIHPFSRYYFEALRRSDYKLFEPMHRAANAIFMLGVKVIYRPLRSLFNVGSKR